MRSGLLRIGLLTLGVLAGGQDLVACGDKFLMPGRGVSYQIYKARVPGSIVIFAPNDPAGAGTLRSVQLQAALRAAGHRLAVAQDASEVNRLVAAGRVDLVITDFGKATAITQARPASGSKATVVPVMAQGNKSEATACRANFDCRLKNGDKLERYITTVNSIMVDRAKALKAARGN